MAAISRWVKYPIDAIGIAGDGESGCRGDRGFSIGTSDPGDNITLSATTNRLYLSIDGESGPYITLVSGANLDPRFIAKDITEKLHAIPSWTGTNWTNAICKWENAYDPQSYISYGYRFKIYSGTNGSSSTVTVTTGDTNDAGATLGFSSSRQKGGRTDNLVGHAYGFQGTVSVSGTYNGLFDEVYKVVITNDNNSVRGIGEPQKQAGNNYDGVITTGGVFNATINTTYTISVNADSATMGAGTGNVPTITWVSSGDDDDSSGPVELLYPEHWINIGKYGLMVKFSDAVFNTVSPAWTIECHKPNYAYGTNLNGAVGYAQYAWASDRGEKSSSVTTTISGIPTLLGNRGLTIQFNPTGPTDYLQAGDEFYVYCSAPAPEDHGGNGITSLNYGNVTVSTESDVKAVMFEVKSGAIEVSTVKFGLQSHGTFVHHYNQNGDTNFRFGTVGVDHYALGLGDAQKLEWHQNVEAADIDSDTPPNYLYNTKADLTVVQTADDSEAIGNYGLVSDIIFVNIHLGSSETGANSSINMRLYFDYS